MRTITGSIIPLCTPLNPVPLVLDGAPMSFPSIRSFPAPDRCSCSFPAPDRCSGGGSRLPFFSLLLFSPHRTPPQTPSSLFPAPSPRGRALTFFVFCPPPPPPLHTTPA